MPTGCNEPENTVNRGQYTAQQICAATISTIMGRDVAIIRVTSRNQEVMKTTYIRPNDGSRWSNRCMLEGSRALWATLHGRWRNHPEDEVITFDVSNDILTITEKYVDGSSTVKTFTTEELQHIMDDH